MKYEEWAAENLDIRSLSFEEANVVCPFHDDHAPSLRFNMRTGLWYCHGCHEAGNVVSMARRLKVAEPGEEAWTVDQLESELDSLVDEQERIAEPVKKYTERWLDQFRTEEKLSRLFWIGERGLTEPVVVEFGLGWDLVNRAGVIPVRTRRGDLVGVVRRFVDPEAKAKYLNPRGFQRAKSLLFLDRVDTTTVAVTEGPIDALKCWAADVPAVAIYGSSISDDQVRLLHKQGVATVVSFYDNDVAGRMALLRAEQRLKGIAHFSVDWSGWKSKLDPGKLKLEEITELYRGAVPFHTL